MGNYPTEHTPQEILNYSCDKTVAPPTLVVGLLEYNGNGYTRKNTSQLAMKITESGSYTYIAKAPIGSAQGDSAWQALRIEETGGDTIFTWADGNNEFDNTATDLSVHSYS